MGAIKTKSITPVTPITIGCVGALRVAAWVNPEVTKEVFTANGHRVTLSDAAISAIQGQYNGAPLLVKIGYPCGGDCIMKCCMEHFEICCGGPGCFSCYLPVVASYASFSFIWFAKKSSDSPINNPCLEKFCFILPHCSMLGLHCTGLFIPPEDVNFVGDGGRKLIAQAFFMHHTGILNRQVMQVATEQA